MLVFLHEDGVERPVEIRAVADPRGLDRLQRVEHRAGADGQPGVAQRAGEIGDVLARACPARSRRRSTHGLIHYALRAGRCD